jgi:hypothetical protein
MARGFLLSHGARKVVLAFVPAPKTLASLGGAALRRDAEKPADEEEPDAEEARGITSLVVANLSSSIFRLQ